MRFFIIIILFAHLNVDAQQKITHLCAEQKQKSSFPFAKSTVQTSDEDNYDVSYIQFDLSLSNTSSYIQGSVKTTARVVAPSISSYVFELNDTLIIDSIKLNGEITSFNRLGDICSVNVSGKLNKNDIFSAQVYYRGYPPKRPSIISGLQYDPYSKVTFSFAEPYQASLWWPCKQSLRDKIDSVDMWVTVPPNCKVGSNGLLKNITPVSFGQMRYEWNERYPIDYYLISVAVGNYFDTSFYMHFSGSNDSMLIMNYIGNFPYALSKPESMIDSVGLMINYFSSLFGRYPFWKEKYGHCFSLSNISMENQTMTTTNFADISVVAHELTHQWFGDRVTCGTWHDIWLNEGFATYGQYLFYSHFHDITAGLKNMKLNYSSVLSIDSGSVYVSDTTNVNRIFDDRLTYNKGAAVIHMLRFWFNNDSEFFQMLQNYQQQFAWSTATTEDFKNVVEKSLNQKLDTFFNQWIYGQGFPYYYPTWNQVNDVIFLKINQVSSWPSSVFTFSSPIEIKLFSSQGDTIVRVYNNQPSQVFEIISDKIIDSIAIDPNSWLLYKLGQKPIKDTSINTLPSNAVVYPNPATTVLLVAYKNLNDPTFILYDVSGKTIIKQQMQWQSGIAQFDVHFLPRGIYLYKIADGKNIKSSGRILKE